MVDDLGFEVDFSSDLMSSSRLACKTDVRRQGGSLIKNIPERA